MHSQDGGARSAGSAERARPARTSRISRGSSTVTASRAFARVNDKVEAITRDINVTVKKIPLKEQANAVVEIEVTR